jgi:hypothetical protein
MPDQSSRSFHLASAIILLLAWAAIFSTHAETLPLKHFTTSDGLAHDRVNRIVRLARLLWFCTAEGQGRDAEMIKAFITSFEYRGRFAQ